MTQCIRLPSLFCMVNEQDDRPPWESGEWAMPAPDRGGRCAKVRKFSDWIFIPDVRETGHAPESASLCR